MPLGGSGYRIDPRIEIVDNFDERILTWSGPVTFSQDIVEAQFHIEPVVYIIGRRRPNDLQSVASHVGGALARRCAEVGLTVERQYPSAGHMGMPCWR
jgi:hypothetical protein